MLNDIYGVNEPAAVLPAGEWINPRKPETNPYWSKGQVAYVLFKVDENRTRPTRVLTSFGDIRGWKVGTVIGLKHDQTWKHLGFYRIVGIIDYRSQWTDGDVPDAAIKHCVMK